MLKTLTCIVCPNGCEITADMEEGAISRVAGASCRRGEEYARQELTAPKRTIASSVRLLGGELPVVSVRLDRPVPKERIFDVMQVIRGIRLAAPVRIGEIAAENVLGLGSNVIVTKNVAAGCGENPDKDSGSRGE